MTAHREEKAGAHKSTKEMQGSHLSPHALEEASVIKEILGANSTQGNKRPAVCLHTQKPATWVS